jgi:hypothetical protein
MSNEEWMELQGRLLAHEAVLLSIAWTVISKSTDPVGQLAAITATSARAVETMNDGKTEPRALEHLRSYVSATTQELTRLADKAGFLAR